MDNQAKSVIVTTDLELRLHSASDLLALIAGAEEYEKQFGIPAAEGLRDFIVSGEVSAGYLEELRQRVSAEPDPFVDGFAVVSRTEWQVVGLASFKGGPSEQRAVEVAYAIVPSHQGRGLATQAASALVQFAFRTGQVDLVLAHTLPVENPSTGVLRRCGFERVGSVVDPDDGEIWRWELRNRQM